MSQPELVAAVARALGTVVTTHQPADLPRVALSIVIDPYTPFPKPKFHAPSPKTLPYGFVESVLQAEQARRPDRSASTPSSPAAKSASESALLNPSTGSTDKRGLCNIFNLSVVTHGPSSVSPTHPNTASSSVNASLAGSRASSPRGSRDLSPRPSLYGFLPSPLSYGVVFEDESHLKTHRSSFSAHLPSLLGGGRIPIAEDSVDLCPSAHIKPKGEPCGRRRTFDVPAGLLPTSPVHKTTANKGAAVTLSAFLGLSSANNRVAPDAEVAHEPN
jgi:hypothetical protein